MDIFALYATDPKLEQKGKEFDFGGGVFFTIARAHNSTYTRMLNQRFEAFKHVLELKDTPEQIEEAKRRSNLIMAEVMAHSILLGWRGPVEYKGETLPWSVANAQKLLEVEQFQQEIARRAGDYRNFLYQVEAEAEKNSVTTSDGTSSGAPT